MFVLAQILELAVELAVVLVLIIQLSCERIPMKYVFCDNIFVSDMVLCS